MGLKRFDGKLPGEKKNFKQVALVLCICLITVLSFTSYALYQVQDQKNIANSKVGEFSKLAILIDGLKSKEFPAKNSGKVFDKVECTNGGIASWSSYNWKLDIKEISGPTECTVHFKTGAEPEAPDLNNGLIPVVYENNTWRKADTSKEWYNYYNQWWANAVTVSSATRNTYANATAGTEVKISDIETMWVWIPRYEYQYTNLSTQYAGGTQALPGGITINFISKDVTTPSSDNFTVHDAFWWDNNNDGVKEANEQLSGIWVAKFEISASSPESDTLQNPIIKPNVTSWRNARIGTFWTAIHNNMNGSKGQTTYGITNSDTHMMKNMEWGAVAYLSQSKYGKFGNANYEGANKEIYQNKSAEYKTGMSNGTPSTNTTNTQVTYEVEGVGTGASTTGNIYGIYDLSGCAYENIMGVMKESTNTEPAVGNGTTYNSGFSGKLVDGTEYKGTYESLKDIGSKYYDLYNYGTSKSDTSRYHKGDATYETSGWYSDDGFLVNTAYPWCYRGAGVGSSVNTGMFNSNIYYGSANKNGSTRIVLVHQI